MASPSINKYHAVEHPETKQWVIIAATAQQREPDAQDIVWGLDQIIPGVPPFGLQGDAQQLAVHMSRAYEVGRADEREGTP
jgi:hypothetical protein